jgi:hypothetical protein
VYQGAVGDIAPHHHQTRAPIAGGLLIGEQVDVYGQLDVGRIHPNRFSIVFIILILISGGKITKSFIGNRKHNGLGYAKQGRVVRIDRGVQILTYWPVVYFGQFYENYKSSANIWTAFFCRTSYVLNFAKRVGLHFGRFFHKLIRSP